MNLNFRLSTQVKDTESASETVIFSQSLNNSIINKNTIRPNIKPQDNTENFDTFIEKKK